MPSSSCAIIGRCNKHAVYCYHFYHLHDYVQSSVMYHHHYVPSSVAVTSTAKKLCRHYAAKIVPLLYQRIYVTTNVPYVHHNYCHIFRTLICEQSTSHHLCISLIEEQSTLHHLWMCTTIPLIGKKLKHHNQIKNTSLCKQKIHHFAQAIQVTHYLIAHISLRVKMWPKNSSKQLACQILTIKKNTNKN